MRRTRAILLHNKAFDELSGYILRLGEARLYVALGIYLMQDGFTSLVGVQRREVFGGRLQYGNSAVSMRTPGHLVDSAIQAQHNVK